MAGNRSFGVILSIDSLRFQSLVDVVALPAGFLVVDLHVERQRKLACRKDRIKMVRQRPENMLAGLFAGGEIAAFANPQPHAEKSVLRPPPPDVKLPAP